MTEAGWHSDPTGRHELRWFDGEQWTVQVADGGRTAVDDLGPASSPEAEPTVLPAAATPSTQGLRAGPREEPDRYELIELVASGGEGLLWRASVHVDSVDLPVALKVMHTRATPDIDEWRRRWQAQSEVLRSLDHPNLVRVREVFEGPEPHVAGVASSSRALYLVMSWIDGESLHDWVTRRPGRDLRDSILLIDKLAEAVDYLHNAPVAGRAVLHRDIKPSNVIVSGSSVTLVDFGLVRLVGGAPLTQAIGSPMFWAPEVAQGQEYSAAADRYSFGATAYFVLTGGAPTPGDVEGMRSALMSVPGAADPVAFADHVLQMLSAEPSARPTSVASWARDLAVGALSGRYGPEATTIHRTSGATTVGSAPTRRRGRGRRRAALAVGGAVLLGGTGAGAYVLFGQGDEPARPEVVSASSDSEGEHGADDDAIGNLAPDVVGQALDRARDRLESDGYTVKVRYEEADSDTAPGQVISQEPPAGTGADGSILLVVAKAPSNTPDVVGQQLAAATRSLEALGVTVVTVEALDETQPDGRVLEQSPPAGSPFADEVTVTVSRRPVITFLSEQEEVEGYVSMKGLGNVSGDTYTRSVMTWTSTRGGTANVGYDLGRGYRLLRATIGIRDDAKSGSKVKVEVLGDGRVLYTDTFDLGQATPIELDVTGVLRLRLVVTNLELTPSFVWGDLQVLGAPDEVPSATE